MNKTDIIVLGILGLFLVALLAILYGASKYENHTIEQAENLSVLCVKAYKSELKDDRKVQEICRDVPIRLFDEEGK